MGKLNDKNNEPVMRSILHINNDVNKNKIGGFKQKNIGLIGIFILLISIVGISSFVFAANTTPITVSDIAQHNTSADCWTAIDGNVYNLTSYISSHPGGVGPISLLCGIDGTSIFHGQHGGGSFQLSFVSNLQIGVLTNVTNSAPMITVIGSNPVSVMQNSVYVDAGATATDVQDGNLTANITTSGSVDTAIPGNYTITYMVTDSGGMSDTALRLVIVTPGPVNTPPVITVVGSNPVSVMQNSVYVDAGASATDTQDGNLTANITTVGGVNTAIPGNYSIMYAVMDSGGLTDNKTRLVIVMSVMPGGNETGNGTGNGTGHHDEDNETEHEENETGHGRDHGSGEGSGNGHSSGEGSGNGKGQGGEHRSSQGSLHAGGSQSSGQSGSSNNDGGSRGKREHKDD